MVIYVFRDVDQVHDMMDDIAEQQDVAREISDAISNPVAFGQDIDEVNYHQKLFLAFEHFYYSKKAEGTEINKAINPINVFRDTEQVFLVFKFQIKKLNYWNHSIC